MVSGLVKRLLLSESFLFVYFLITVYMVEVSKSGEGPEWEEKVRAEARADRGLDPLVLGTNGVQLLTGTHGRVCAVVGPDVVSSGSSPVRHKPNRNAVFPSGSLTSQQEAILC